MMRDRTFRSGTVIPFLPVLALFFASSEIRAGLPASFGDLQVGQTVAIEGRPMGGRAILASEIEIQKRPALEKLKGPIQVMDGKENSLVVLGVKVVAARDAQIEDRERKPIRFSSLQTGWDVKVKGSLRGDGALYAAEIKVSKDRVPGEAELEGKIQAIDKARKTLTIMGVTIRVTPTTKIEFD